MITTQCTSRFTKPNLVRSQKISMLHGLRVSYKDSVLDSKLVNCLCNRVIHEVAWDGDLHQWLQVIRDVSAASMRVTIKCHATQLHLVIWDTDVPSKQEITVKLANQLD